MSAESSYILNYVLFHKSNFFVDTCVPPLLLSPGDLAPTS